MSRPGCRVRALLAAAVAVGAAALAPRAAAAEEPVLVWSVQVTGSTEAPVLRDQLYRSIVGGLAAAGVAVMPRAQIAQRLAAAPGLVGCETATCLKRAAELLGVRAIIRAEVEIFGSSYVFRLDHLGPDGKVRERREGRCDVCTIDEVNDQVSQLAVRLARRPVGPPPPGPVPPVPVEEHPVTTPAPPPVAASTPASAPAPAPWWHLAPVWKWSALAASVAVLAVGASLVGIDGHGTCSPATSGAACPRLYDTRGAGWALTAIGIAALGGSGVWLWLDRPSRGPEGRRAAAGGVGVHLAF